LLAEYGLHLNHPGIGLLELADLVGNLPPGCALWRATGGDQAWSLEAHLLAVIEWRLQLLAWMQTKDGQEGRNQPEPIQPPHPAAASMAEADELDERVAAYLARTGQTTQT